MLATTSASTNGPNDGSDDKGYQTELKAWKFEGARDCLLEVLVVGVLAFLLSRVVHWASFKALGEWAQHINYWITYPTLGLVFWGMAITYMIGQWGLWVDIKDNYSWVLVDFFPGRSNRKMKFPTGIYFKPTWWWLNPENLTYHENQTVELPSHDYSTKNGEGGATVSGSFTYRVPFKEAESFTKQDKSVIKTRVVGVVKSQIGPVIASYEVADIVGQSVAVAEKVSHIFVGKDRSVDELACNVEITTVTIDEVTLDEKTKAEREKNQAAEALAKRTPDLQAVTRDKDGNPITDHIARADAMRAAGIDPGRVIEEKKTIIEHRADENMVKVAEGLGAGFAQGLAMLANITQGLADLKGGGDKPKGGKGPKGGK